MQKSNLSNKISEKYFFDDDKIIIKKTFDASHMLNDAKYSREVVQHSFGGYKKLIGHVDIGMVGKWLKEAGVSWDDTEAAHEVVLKNLASNEFSALRVWEGSY